MRHAVLAAALVPALALAQRATFEAADRQLQEQSFSKACDSFTALLKAGAGSDTREATAKRARACVKVGRGNHYEELRKLADGAEKDYARAYALWALSERGDRDFQATLAALKPLATGGDRQGREAKALFIAGCFTDLERNSWDARRVYARVDDVLERSDKPAEKARARLFRGRALLREGKQDRAEAELLDVGQGSTEWADDALFELGQHRENQQRYVPALELYDAVVKRFSPQTSNVRESAQDRAREIRRPSVSLGVTWLEVPGSKPQVSLSFRNVKKARWTLRRADPSRMDPRSAYDLEASLASAAQEVVSTWDAALKESGPHVPSSTTFDLAATAAGVYLLEVDADGQRAREPVFIGPNVTVLKVGLEELAVWTVDAMTGQAVPNAEVHVYLRERSDQSEHLTATSDAQGLAQLRWPGHQRITNVVAWVKAKGAWSYASGYGNYWSANEEKLAYVMTDRPLYKPGEEVGLKLFVRSRRDGPSVPIASAQCTLFLRDPQGREVGRPTLTTNSFGTAATTLKLAKDAQLGQWSGYVSCQNHSVSQAQLAFRVEEYKPPEYTVSVSPLGAPKPGEKVKFKVAASFFFGGPVANAQGRAVVRVTPWAHQWKSWPEDVLPAWAQQYGYGHGRGHRYGRRGYDEDEDYGGYYGQLAQHTLTFKTGADGTAEVEVPAVPNASQDLEYQVQVFVTDASRREVTGAGALHVSRDAFFADLRTDRLLYKPGEKVTVQLRAEDPNGKPVTADVRVKVFRLDDKGGEAGVAEGKGAIRGGAGAVTLSVDALGPARVVVLEATGDKRLASSDVWLTDENKPLVPNEAGFLLMTDRGPLRPGQPLRVLVAAPSAGGHALLTLENERLAHARAVELKGRARFVELPITGDLAPNAWLHAGRVENGMFHQAQQTVLIRGSEVELDVAVSPALKVTEPGTPMAVSVNPGARAPRGAGYEVALTAVDEALFAIEPERTDFLDFFGRRPRQHQVHTSSTLSFKSFRPPKPKEQPRDQPQPEASRQAPAEPDALAADKAEESASRGMAAPASAPAPARMVAGAKAVSEKKAKSAEAEADDAAGPGGNEAPGQAPVKTRTDFGSSAGWTPQLKGQVGGAARAQVKFTDSLTSWRLIATVVTEGPHLGVGRATVRTEKPLMVRLQAPRFFTERDTVTLSAIVSSRLPQATDVDVSLSAPGLKALDPTAKKVRVEPGADVRFEARFLVVETGERVVKAVARGGGKADAMEWKLPSNVHGAAQREFFTGRLKDRNTFEFVLPEKRKEGATRLELTLSPSLLAVMLDGLPYLAQYPYGCTEQTLSRFVPAAIARRAVKDLGLPETRIPANLDDMVQAGLTRLYGFQHGDGGWGWWQTDNSNKWMTAYAVYGLTLGRDAGLAVDAGAIERARGWLKSNLGGALNAPETHAFMTFVLAETGGAPKAALDSAFAYRTRLPPRGRALVALALLAAKDPRARIAVENLDDVVKAAKERADAAVGEANDAWSTSAAIEATSWVLMAMVRHDPNAAVVKPLVDFLVLRRNGGRWRNTRDTAFAVYALSELAKKEAAQLSQGGVAVLVNGREVKRVKYQKGGLDLGEPLVLGDAAFKAGKNVVELRRDGGGTGYFAALFDVYNQDDFIKGRGGDVVVKRSYTLLGRPAAEKAEAPTEYGMPVDSGVRVRVDLEVKANKAVEFVMLEDLKPAGLEAVMQKSGPEVCGYQCTHAELRTDRVAIFLTELPVGTRKLSYELRAEVPGKFSALPARVEAMYAPEITATSDEMRFEVRDAPEAGVAGH